MLPEVPPKLSGKDFDPAAMNAEEDVEMGNNDEEVEGEGSGVELSSVEINILIYLYLLESNFPHTAFTLLSESSLPTTSLFQHFHPSFPTPSTAPKSSGPNKANGPSPTSPTFGSVGGKIPRGELVRKLWKGVRWEEVERHVNKNGEPYKPSCPSPFHLLIPHICPPTYPSSAQNPPLPLPEGMRLTSPPRRSEAFPPPQRQTGEAGPSRPRSSRGNDQVPDKGKGKEVEGRDRLSVNGVKVKPRRSRGNSTESNSNSRNQSPVRSGVGKRDKEEGSRRDKEEGSRRDKEEGGRRDKEKDRVVSLGEKIEKKRGRPSAETIALREKRDKAGKNDGDDSTSTIPKIKSRGFQKSTEKDNGPSREESPVERKRKRLEEGTSSDRRPKSSSTSTSARNGKTTSRSDTSKSRRGVNNPLWISDDAVSIFPAHRDSVTCLGWNPRNNSLLASGSADGTARLWDFDSSTSSTSGALITKGASLAVKHTSIESSRKELIALAWHPEGSVIATASGDGVGRLFTPGGQLQGIMSYGRGSLNAIKFSPDGRSVLTAKNDFVVSLWTVGKGYAQMLNRSYDAHTKEVNDVDWLDDNVFASAGNDHTIFIFHTSDKFIRYTLKGHTDDVTQVKWSPAQILSSSSETMIPQSPESRLLASVSDDGYVLVWKLPTYPAERGRLGSRSASPVKSSGTPNIGNVGLPKEESNNNEDYFEGQGKKGKEGIEFCVARLCVVDAENKRLNALEWSPACREGMMLLAAGAQDSTVKIFNISTGQLLHSLSGLESGTASLTFSPLGIPGFPLGALAAGGWNGQLGIWDVESGEKRGEWETDVEGDAAGPGVLALDWRNDGKQLALGLQNKLVVTVGTDLEGMAQRAKAGKKVDNKN